MAAAIIAVVAWLPRYLSTSHSSASGLVANFSGSTACPSTLYPAGAGYRFEQCAGGLPIGWPRCSTLTVFVDPANAPATWPRDRDNALRQLSDATGLHFRTVSSGKADISIAWTAFLITPGAEQADRAGLTRVSYRSGLADSTLTEGTIQISDNLFGGAGPNGELPVLLHELGHAVGLGHYEGPDVMNPLDQGYAAYQSGDIEGLVALYRPDSCA